MLVSRAALAAAGYRAIPEIQPSRHRMALALPAVNAALSDVSVDGTPLRDVVVPRILCLDRPIMRDGRADIILSVEGKAVRTEADLRKALMAEKPGSIVTLRIFNPRAQSRRVERIRLGDAQ